MLYRIIENGEVIDENLSEWEADNLYPGYETIPQAIRL